MNDKIHTPARLGVLQARNRIAMPAIHLGLAGEDHGMDRVCEFYAERSATGVGLVTVGVCNTWPEADTKLYGALQLAREDDIKPMSALAAAIKGGGALAGAQISPLVGYDNPRWKPDPGVIEDLVRSIGEGGRRAREAGFDFIEIMLSGGSFLSHIVSPVHNNWEIDGYSKGWAQRLRAPLESVEEIRNLAGDTPLLARIHCHEFLDGGYGHEGAIRIATALEKAGVDGINVTGAGHRTQLPQLTSQTPPLAFAHFALAISRELSIPTFYGGRIRTPQEALDALQASGATFVNVGRALVVDPEWPCKARTGDTDGILTCMACGACFDQAFSKKSIRCSLNPDVGVASRPTANSSGSQTALVAGGGPSGMQAAFSLVQRGYRVTMFERDATLGGRWNLAAGLIGRNDLISPRDTFQKRLHRAGVEVLTDVELTPELAREKNANLIVLATGGIPRSVELPGLESHENVMHTDEILADRQRVVGDVAIVGAGGAGLEIAIHLATMDGPTDEALAFLARFGDPAWIAESLKAARRRRITLLKRKGFVGKGVARSVRWTMVQELEHLGVRVVDRAEYREVTPAGVVITNGRTGQGEIIQAGTIVLATGYRPDPTLVESYEGAAERIVVVGDAFEVGNIGAAVSAGWGLP